MQYDDVTTNQIWRTATILKIIYRYISAVDHSILTKFGVQMQILVKRITTCQDKISKFNMADGRHKKIVL